MEDRILRAIKHIIELKQRNGDVLPYATSIEVAHLLHTNAVEVEKIAKSIEGIHRGRTANYHYYYE